MHVNTHIRVYICCNFYVQYGTLGTHKSMSPYSVFTIYSYLTGLVWTEQGTRLGSVTLFCCSDMHKVVQW